MWQSRNYTSDQLDEMLSMTEEYYGSENDITKKELINHEYFQNNSGKPFIRLAYDDENNILAGQYITIPMSIKVGNKIQPAILSLNTLTREQYRGQKIFTSLAEEVYQDATNQGITYCYGAPNPNSHPGFVKKLGFKDIGVLPLWLKVIHPSVIVKDKFKNGLLTALSKLTDPFFCPSKLREEQAGSSGTIQIKEITGKNVGIFDDFWSRIQSKYPVMGVRTSAYILWRYINMPLRDYFILGAFEGNTCYGYIIGREMPVADMKCGMVVDFLVEKGRMDVASSLLTYLQQCFYRHGVGLMGCLMMPNFEEARCMKKKGFFICPKKLEPQPFPIIYRKFCDSENDELFNDFSNWFFTMGDYDVI